MKISTVLIFTCAGAVAFAVLYDNKGGGPVFSRGVPGSGPAGAPASNGWFSSAKFSVPAATASPAPASPGVFSTLFEFIDHGIAIGAKHAPTRQRGALRIARGTVLDRLDSGVVLDCSGWVVHGSFGIYAGDGLGMNPVQANLVDAHELQQFGRLMAVDQGTVRQSQYERSLWAPESYLAGTVLVTGYPAAALGSAKGFKVVVAPDGAKSWRGQSIPAYTASFTLATETRSPKGW